MTEKRRQTIFDLKPDPPQVCSPEDFVASAAILMANQRVHCVLVNDSTGALVGLFTAKDLAFRVVGMGLDPKSTKVRDIMTTTPLCLHMDTPITDALETMVQRGVRHLPLLDNSGSIKGVLDITRCFHQAMLKLEKITASAHKLSEVLSDVALDYEDLHNKEAQRIVDDVRKLSHLIEVPSLANVIDRSKPPSFVDSSDSVFSAAKMMVKNSTTALLVRDRTSLSRKVIGIFTSKDICYRVLAKGYDPNTCTVARVLTTSPEFARSDTNISAALRQMYQGHYLNIPVIDHQTNEIISIISVLSLTYAALSQLGKSEKLDRDSFNPSTWKEVSTRLGNDTAAPMWDNFWSSLEKSFDDIHTLESSVHSKSPSHSRSHTPLVQTRRSSQNQPINLGSRRSSYTRRLTSESERSEGSTLRRLSAESLSRTRFYIKRKSVIFKVSFNSSETHKIKMIVSDDVSIYDDIKLLDLLKEELSSKVGLDLAEHDMFYFDEERDLISIADESDLMEAINSADRGEPPIVELVIKRKGEGDGFLRTVWEFFSNVASFKLFDEGSTRPGSIFTGTVTVLILGIVLGFSWTKGKLLWVK